MQSLSLSGPNFTDAGLNEMKELKNLRLLNLRGTGVSDAGIKQFKVSNPGTRIVKLVKVLLPSRCKIC